MLVRDRIRELRRVPASQLRPNPHNWRTHPPAQRDALRGVLAEVGYAGALVARELEDGTLELIDGHLRAETTHDMDVPVLVLDVTADEAAKLLALIDPLAGMAESDTKRLADLVTRVETENEAVRSLLDRWLDSSPSQVPPDGEAPMDALAHSFQVVVECRDEDDQRSVFERLRGEGYECRLLVL